MTHHGRFADARWVGSYRTRDSAVEVDLVGTSARDGGRVGLVGAVTWRQSRPGFTDDVHLDVQLGPEQIVDTLR